MRSRSRRSSTAIAVAVFLSGAVLLGLEIAASRVLAPFFGNSLYVWGALIGVVLAGPRDRLLARRRARRPLADVRASSSRCSRSAPLLVLRDPLRRRPRARASRRLGPRAAAEPAARHGRSSSGPERRPRARSRRSRCGCGARSIERWDERRAASSRSRRRAASSGTFATAFWLDPRVRHRPGARARRRRAVRARPPLVALAERLLLAAVGALALAAAVGGALVSLAPGQGGTLAAAPRRTSRRSTAAARRGRPALPSRLHSHGFTSSTARTRSTTGSRVVEDDRHRYLRFDSSFQSGDVPRRPVPDALRVRRLPLSSGSPTGRARAASSSSASAAARRRSGCGATSPSSGSRSRSSTPRS